MFLKNYFLILLLLVNLIEAENRSNKKNNQQNQRHNFNAHKEGALLMSSVAQIINDTDDTENVLSAILKIVTIFFRLVLFVEDNNEEDHNYKHHNRSVATNEEIEFFVLSCVELVNKLNISEKDKEFFLNEIRNKIVEVIEETELNNNKEIEFCTYVE